MNETQVTLTGWLGSDVSTRPVGDSSVTSFRLACTPRRYNPRTEEWFDAETQWYSVNAWRSLGAHCAESLRSGDPVVVHGKLSAHRWTNAAGVEVTSFEIEAAVVGHDLNRGTSHFRKTPRSSAVLSEVGTSAFGSTESGTRELDPSEETHGTGPEHAREEVEVAVA